MKEKVWWKVFSFYWNQSGGMNLFKFHFRHWKIKKTTEKKQNRRKKTLILRDKKKIIEEKKVINHIKLIFCLLFNGFIDCLREFFSLFFCFHSKGSINSIWKIYPQLLIFFGFKERQHTRVWSNMQDESPWCDPVTKHEHFTMLSPLKPSFEAISSNVKLSLLMIIDSPMIVQCSPFVFRAFCLFLDVKHKFNKQTYSNEEIPIEEKFRL